ncbi:MAG TPA: ATP-binding protein [Bacteroidales bacterium]|nr:ATP-binding protein [Bacteroidales bacterium]
MKRTLFYEILPQLEHKNAIVICGMRQVGKTTLMQMLYDMAKGNKLWFDLDNPLDQMIFEATDYNQIYHDLKKQASLKEGERLFVFIDEIQNFPVITKIIKYLIDHYQVKFIVTGSSNYYLRNLFPESLSGRKFLYQLHPLSFNEFLFFSGVIPENGILNQNTADIFEKHSRSDYEKRSRYYDDYIEYGGFPEVALTKDTNTKKLVLKNIFASFFEKDIKVFTELKDVRELRDLILLLAPRNGNMVDVSKIASELGINRVKIYSYLEFLQGIFFLKLIPKYSKSVDKRVASGKKIYFSDTGILNTVAKVTEGQLFETAVCNQLEHYGRLAFYNKRNTAEIDFILDQETALEVKLRADQNDMVKLKKLADTLGITNCLIISKKFNDFEGVVFPQFI